MSNHPEYFGDNWCPLTGKLPDKESLSGKDKRIFDCIEIIESARKIWDSDPQGKYPERKLNSAQMLWKLFRNLDIPFLITDLYDVIPWSKIYSNSDIDKQITDYEIKAVFLIFIAFKAINYCERGAQRDATALIDNIEKELNLIWKNKAVEREPKGHGTPKTEINSELFLENNHHLKILDNNNCVKLTENLAELVRFMARQDKENKGLDLADILYIHYASDVRNKTTLSKKDRQPFEKEKKRINDRCKEALKKDLIKSLGGKKFTLSFKVILPKNFQKHYQ